MLLRVSNSITVSDIRLMVFCPCVGLASKSVIELKSVRHKPNLSFKQSIKQIEAFLYFAVCEQYQRNHNMKKIGIQLCR